jgi:hypothetical protein
MHCEQQWIGKEVMVHFKVLSGGTEKNHENLRITDVLDEIKTGSPCTQVRSITTLTCFTLSY